MPSRKFNRKSQSQMKQQLAKAQQNAKKTPVILKREQTKPQAQGKAPAPPPPPQPPQVQQQQQQPLQQSPQQPLPNEQRPVEEAPAETSSSYQANRDWRVLRNRLNPEGTTIEMVYTGEECLPPAEEPEEPEEQQQQQQQPGQGVAKPRWPHVEARPGITHANVTLPQGVLPTTNSLPDMPALINAIDFFAHPEHHQPDPSAGPRTTVTVTPKALPTAASTMEVVPLGTYEALPLEPGTLNMAFQSFSTMDFTLEPAEEGSDPSCTFYSAEMSPSIMLTAQQQHRLQAAVLQQEVPLAEAVLPVVQDIRREYVQMRELGQQPATQPIPHSTMQIYSRNPYSRPPSSPSTSSVSSPPRSQFGGAPYGYGGYGSGPGSVSGSQTGPAFMPGSVPSSQTGPRLVLLPTPQMAPIPPNYYGQPPPPPNYGQPLPPNYGQPVPPPNYGQPLPPNYGQPLPPNYGQPMPPPNYGQPPRYPVYVQPTYMPNYGQAPQPPRYPVYVQPTYMPNPTGQQPPRYPVPVYVQPNYIPNYGQPVPQRYPVYVQPTYIPTYGQVSPPQANGPR